MDACRACGQTCGQFLNN
ncbi:hypothetical protein [Roseateles sp.]